jgi:thiol:disulfide interchange protein DsbD
MIVALAWAGLFGAAMANPVRTPHVEAQLHAARALVSPGETVTLILRQKIIPGWHVYWINPGDSGYATALNWTLPAGVTAGPLQHPAPRTYTLGPLVNYVHQGEVLYPITLTIPASAPEHGALELKAVARWLVCKEECIPEEVEVRLRLPLARKGRDDPDWAVRAAQAVSDLPNDLTATGFDASITKTAFKIVAPKAGGNPLADALAKGETRSVHFFPFSQSLIDHAAPQSVKRQGAALSVQTRLSSSFTAENYAPDGVLTLETKQGEAWVKQAFQFGAPPVEGSVTTPVDPPGDPASASGDGGGGESLTIWTALAFGFLGGLILNVMPCVFPVLSLKALSFAQAAPNAARRDGLLFLAGVMVTFLALAGLLIAFTSAGAQIGWGFQLQEPWVATALGLLFFAMGLNLAGFFEFGGGLQQAGAGLAQKGGGAGAFFTGALAVLAASPCTAPYMGGALGWAATQPPAASLAVFGALGLGFAAPFTALAFAPGLRSLLPKPGAWMDRFKQFMAFPMFATAVWLAWVVTVQAGAGGTLAVLALALALAFSIWALKGGWASRLTAVAGLIAAIALAAGSFNAARVTPTINATADGIWSPERVAALRAAGKPVFVNFTAAWCVSCQANEAVALSRPRVQEAFAAAGITALKADWTRRDAVIAAELSAHGRSGVPLYLYVPAGADRARVLPQILSEQIVLDAIADSP